MRFAALAVGALLTVASCAGDDGESTTAPAAGPSTTAQTDVASSAPPETRAPTTTDTSTATSTAQPVDTAAPDGALSVDRLPWNIAAASTDPTVAVAAFMEWSEELTSVRLDAWTAGEPEYYPDDLGAGVLVRFDEFVSNVTTTHAAQPETKVELVEHDGAWFVTEAVSPSIVVEQPIDLTSNPIELSFFNALLSGGIDLHLYADGVTEPVVTARFNGGGIFTTGMIHAVIDLATCTEETGAFEIDTCTGPPEPGAAVTLVIATDNAIGTSR